MGNTRFLLYQADYDTFLADEMINAHYQGEVIYIETDDVIEEGFILDVLQNYTTYKTFYQINKEIEEDPKMQTASAKR